MKKILSVALLILFQSGCSTRFYSSADMNSLPATSEASFAAASTDSSCCDSLQSIPLTPLPLDTQTFSTFDNGSPKLKFAENKRFISAYQLPQNADISQLDVEAIVINKTVFAPLVLFYDAQWNKLSQINSETFSYSPARFTDPDRFKNSISLTSADTAQARYLIITSDPQAYNEKIQLAHPEELYAKNRGIIALKRQKTYAALVPTGVVRLTLKSKSIITEMLSGGSSQPAGSLSSYKKVTGVVSSTAAESDLRHKAIKTAVDKKDFSTAMRLVKEAEQAGDKEAGQLFIEALQQIQQSAPDITE
ncbi:MalM family protein [Psychromonas aquimarina]|uniref:MalM family protein n=1 Tax=Psychromonas aquimarina TaxID=444919 RepID=UPI00040C2419|nr:MalM family protein [Psychromonas aquimarina]